MKKILSLIAALLCLQYSTSYAQCANGDAEFGNFTNWNGFIGLNNGPIPGTLDLTTFTPAIIPGRHDITNAGTYDPIVVGNLLETVAEGNFAIKLGNSTAGSEAEILSYTFTFDKKNKMSFRYALVLEGFHPSPTDNGFFEYWISTTNNLATSKDPGNLISGNKFQIDPTNTWYQGIEGQPSDGWKYKPWQTECVNIPEDMDGQTVTIYFATADCNAIGHGGYAYIDGLCKSNYAIPAVTLPTNICSFDGLVVNATASQNYDSHYWKIRQVSSGISATTPVNSDPITTSFNLGTFFTDQGHILQDGLYHIQFFLTNCFGTIRKDYYVQVDLPDITGPEKFYGCCNGQGANVTLSASVSVPAVSGATITWFDENWTNLGPGTSAINTSGGITTVQSSIVVHTSSYSRFIAMYTDWNGCKNYKWVYAVAMPVISAPIRQECLNGSACGTTLLRHHIKPFICDNNNIDNSPEYEALWKEAIQYQWSTGESSQDINTQAGISTYTCTYSTPCTTVTQSITIYPEPTGAFPTLWYSTGMQPIHHPFRVYHVGIAAWTKPAYNASKYRLRIFNRWGNMIVDKVETPCPLATVFTNGEIEWDGFVNGVIQPMDTYHFILELENCNTNMTTVINGGQFTLVW
jgi:hypothetical protein